MTLNKLPEELRTQIVEKYTSLFPTKYVLRDWIPLEKLDWWNLSKNPNDGAIELLKKNIKKNRLVMVIFKSKSRSYWIIKSKS